MRAKGNQCSVGPRPCWWLHIHVCAQSLSRVRLLRPHGLQPASLHCPWNSPGNNTGVGYHFLLQGIFLTQRSNPHLLYLLQWQADSLSLSHLGSPFTYPYLSSNLTVVLWAELRGVKQLSPSLTASNGGSWDSRPGLITNLALPCRLYCLDTSGWRTLMEYLTQETLTSWGLLILLRA